MDNSRTMAITPSFVQRTSRRSALSAIGLGSVNSAIAAIALVQKGAAKKHGRKKGKKCKPSQSRCGKKCTSLNSSRNCGRCGNRCQEGDACQQGVCCGGDNVICRGECRPDCPSPSVQRPFPQHLGYGASRPSRFSQSQLDGHVQRAYDKWKARYLIDAGRDGAGRQRFRVALGKPGTNNHDVTVSEGQGYGMVIVAHLAGYDDAAQEIFDGLWRFARAHPSEIDGRLMDWRVPGGEGNDSAFDGDCDMAYALLLADAQFGSDGAIDYRAEFNRTIAGVLASTIGPQSHLPMLGDWTDPDGAKYNQETPRTSDFMPGHFRAFRRATGERVWDDVVDACQTVVDRLQANFSPETGLLPDFVQKGPRPADANFLEGPHDGDYNYNAGRDPWRLGTDALLNGDAASRRQAGTIAAWVAAQTSGDPSALRAGYRLDGSTWSGTNYFTSFFAAPLGVAAMTRADLQAWLDAIYDAVYQRQEDYYEDSVTLLCLLVMSGNFWDPTDPA